MGLLTPDPGLLFWMIIDFLESYFLFLPNTASR